MGKNRNLYEFIPVSTKGPPPTEHESCLLLGVQSTKQPSRFLFLSANDHVKGSPCQLNSISECVVFIVYHGFFTHRWIHGFKSVYFFIACSTWKPKKGIRRLDPCHRLIGSMQRSIAAVIRATFLLSYQQSWWRWLNWRPAPSRSPSQHSRATSQENTFSTTVLGGGGKVAIMLASGKSEGKH